MSLITNSEQQRERELVSTPRAVLLRSAGEGRASQVVITQNPCEDIRIGTWNVRTMQSEGKVENIVREMEREGLEVLGMSEVRWTGSGEVTVGDAKIVYSGGVTKERGVAIALRGKAKNSIVEVETVSDRIMRVKLKASPVDLNIVQVYMPTSSYSDEDVEDVYEQVEEVIERTRRGACQIVMGDWNSQVGEGREGKTVGEFDLGNRNDRGNRLVEFCEAYNLMVANTWFNQHKRRRYTWKMPGDRNRYQLDYILVGQRYRNGVKNCRARPGADCNSDHNLVRLDMRIRLKRIRYPKIRRRINLEVLKETEGKEAYREEVTRQLSEEERPGVEGRWKGLKGTMEKAARSSLGYQSRKIKNPWITKEILGLIDERRALKGQNTEESKKRYKQLNNQIRREALKAKEVWLESRCNQIEALDAQGKAQQMYERVKEFNKSESREISSNSIQSKDGTLLTEPKDITARWKEHIEELYAASDRQEDIGIELEEEVDWDNLGPGILREEVAKAIRQLKVGKATGDDGIPAELVKGLSADGIEGITKLCQEMYETGTWPEDFTRVRMKPIPKKAGTQKCGEYRTLSLISHTSKVMLNILKDRLEKKIEPCIGSPNCFRINSIHISHFSFYC